VYQARLVRRYGVFYILTVLVLVMLSLTLASDFTVHIHHSFHPLLLWPLTRFPNRPVVSFSQVIFTSSSYILLVYEENMYSDMIRIDMIGFAWWVIRQWSCHLGLASTI
jgi:hypothetical protein